MATATNGANFDENIDKILSNIVVRFSYKKKINHFERINLKFFFMPATHGHMISGVNENISLKILDRLLPHDTSSIISSSLCAQIKFMFSYA